MARRIFPNLTKTAVVVLGAIALIVTFKVLESRGKEKRPEGGRGADGLPLATTPQERKREFLKIFHLDLKGAPPKLSFLLRVLPLAREAGANALLVEYEDAFPFSGRLRNVSAGNAYSPREVRRLVEFAEGMKMEVIPLVQSFGHLEYVLKLEEFRHLREADAFPQEICPLRKEAVDLVKELIRQVMEVHKNARYIHLGCDEVRHLGVCPRCSRRDTKKIFSEHVAKIATHVRSHYPGVTPLIWDDMLRRWTFDDVARSGLGSAVEPVVWVYGNNIFLLVPPFVWNIYRRTFPALWAASAFKGAFGEKEVLPDLSRHLENNLSWMKVFAGGEEVPFPPGLFSGIFLTGWSRYDHFAVLCELLPAGLPSLVLDLVFLERGSPREEAFSRWLDLLGCPPLLRGKESTALEKESLFRSKLGVCTFPGSDLYSGISRYLELKASVDRLAEKVASSGWLSRYNLEKNFTSPWRLLELVPDAGETSTKELSLWKASFLPLVTRYFDESTAFEWQEQNVTPLEETLERIRRDFRRLLRRKTWPRRPLR